LPYTEEDIPHTDPEIIDELLGAEVDMVIDGGPGGIVASTIVDCTKEPFEIIRQGEGIIE
jgi:tRNA A37 threonylcarbamoyladenosine synthetase subunit TsaC/SUA5/YrdC